MSKPWSEMLPWQRVLGELLVIVAGVLIALWIEDWRQARIDRHDEVEYLQRLHVDVEADIERIDGLIRHTENREARAFEVLAFLDSEQETGDAAVITNLSQAGYIAFFRYHRSTIDDLLSTGGLALIRDKDLLREITGYYRAADFLLELDTQKREWIWIRFRDAFNAHVPQLVTSDIESGRLDAPRDVDWTGLRGDPAVRSGLGSVISIARLERRFLKRLRGDGEALLVALEAGS